MKLKVQAQHLQPGDIVGSGDKSLKYKVTFYDEFTDIALGYPAKSKFIMANNILDAAKTIIKGDPEIWVAAITQEK